MPGPVTFEAANDWLRKRVIVPTDMTSAELAMSPDFPAQVRMHSFFSAQVTQANVLDGLCELVDDIADGRIDIATARMRAKTYLAAKGFPADDIGMTPNPPPGVSEEDWKARKKITNLASTRRLDLILRQNAAMAHAIGRREVSMDPAIKRRWPYFRYLARADARPTHGALNNLVLPKDDPFWATHTPPWEFNCRCDIEDADETDAETYGTGQAVVTENEDGSQSAVLTTGSGQTINIGPSPSGYVFRVDAAFGNKPQDFDWAAIKNAVLREKVRQEVNKVVGEALPRESVDAIAQGIVDAGLADEAEFNGLAAPVARKIKEALETLNDEFETYRKGVFPNRAPHQSIGTKEKRGDVYAHANTSLGYINVNPHMFGNEEALERRFRRNIESGFHPALAEGVSVAEAITTHEYAHTLTGRMEISGRRGYIKPHPELHEISNIKSRYTRKINELRHKMHAEGDQEKMLKLRQEFDKVYISGYASKNVDEFMAESFAMVRCGPEAAKSPYAQEVYDVLVNVRGRKQS